MRTPRAGHHRSVRRRREPYLKRAEAPRRAIGTPSLIAAMASVMIVGAWAFWPLAPLAGEAIPAVSGPLSPPKPKPLNLAAFGAPLWVVPPPPPTPVVPAPPTPLKVQLIAIVSDQAGRAALLYDPEQDKLVTVHEGDPIQGRTIERITSAHVRIRDKASAQTLALGSDTGGGQP